MRDESYDADLEDIKQWWINSYYGGSNVNSLDEYTAEDICEIIYEYIRSKKENS